ncbi:MAG: hypothetical protein J5896_02285 [Alphaproteobacteria bacterium]|nr:hypothetical protein [Alphaproteobacteria bacterium]
MSVFNALFSPIKTHHIKVQNPELTLPYEFTFFHVPTMHIDTVLSAKILVKRLGHLLYPMLDKLIKNEQNPTKRTRYMQIKTWIYKKTVYHPNLVEKCTKRLIKNMQNSEALNNLPLDFKTIRQDVCITAILHDIGRLCEVGICNKSVIIKPKALNKSHAVLAYEILKDAHIKPEILLAVKHHDFSDLSKVKTDELYLGLDENGKKLADFYIRVVQDMDKTGNLKERSMCGIQKSAEFFSKAFLKDYHISDNCLQTALSGQYLGVQKGHLLDVMVHYVTRGYNTHFKQTKQMISKMAPDLFKQIYLEAWREYQSAPDKNEERFHQTLRKIARLEEYALSHHFNTKNQPEN